MASRRPCTCRPPPTARRGGEIIAAQLAAVGIKAEITNVEWAQWLETVFRGKNFGLTIVSHTEPMDIGIYANPDYYFQYNNPDFQALISKLNTETDPGMRTSMLQDAQKMIADDYVNGYLFQLATPTVAKAGLQGLWKDAPTQGHRPHRCQLVRIEPRSQDTARGCLSGRPFSCLGDHDLDRFRFCLNRLAAFGLERPLMNTRPGLDPGPLGQRKQEVPGQARDAMRHAERPLQAGNGQLFSSKPEASHLEPKSSS